VIEARSLFPDAGGDGSVGFVLEGIDAYDFSGLGVSGAGDVNGDGIADLIIGAHGADPYGVAAAGETYVVFGRSAAFPAVFDLRTLFPPAGGDGTDGFVLKGVNSYDCVGISVSGAGDVNGDSIDDLLVGAFLASPGGRDSAGESFVIFGRRTGFPASFPLRSLFPGGGGDGSAGFVLKGVAQSDWSGFAVSRAGDVNGDGVDDLLIGAKDADPHDLRDAGETYVIFGRRTAFPATIELRSLFPEAGGDGSTGFVLEGVDPGDASGRSVSGAGDVNGDGIDDLLIGAFGAAPHARSDGGESYVVFGRMTGFPPVFELRSLLPAAGGDGIAGFVIRGIDGNDESGWSVSGAGDVNGDGIDDLLIGAPVAGAHRFGDRAGETYVVFGHTTGFPAAFDLSSLDPSKGGDGSAGFVLKGADPDDDSGFSVRGAGDVNEDGIADLLIGTCCASPDGRLIAGESYVVFGRRTGFPASFELRSLFPAAGGDGSAGFILKGFRVQGYLGTSVSGAGDVNDDGIDDLIIGAYRADSHGQASAGESYVVFGRTMSAGD
jgi:hypothetical protein